MGLLQKSYLALQKRYVQRTCKPEQRAERVGFEPTVLLRTPLFESGTINHSDTSPRILQMQYNIRTGQRQETGDFYRSVDGLAATSIFSSARARAGLSASRITARKSHKHISHQGRFSKT